MYYDVDRSVNYKLKTFLILRSAKGNKMVALISLNQILKITPMCLKDIITIRQGSDQSPWLQKLSIL